MATRNDDPRRRILARLNPAPKQPDWEAWKKVSNAPLWEVVALSCEIEPSDIRGWKAGLSRCRPPKHFEDRLRFAESLLAINGGGLHCRAEGAQSDEARIELGDFSAWLEYEGIKLPPEFPRFPASHPPKEEPEARKLRLTLRIEEEKKRRRNFRAFVAEEEGISVQRLNQIVGTVLQCKKRLAKLLEH